MKIAQVGAYSKFSQADSARQTHCILWLLKNDKIVFENKPTHDFINLKYKRDFLKEQETYDVVIVHSVFHTDVVPLANFKDKVIVSENHTIVNWRNRLVSTCAKYIFICEGQPFTLSGWQIGELDYYNIEYRDALFTVYKRKL